MVSQRVDQILETYECRSEHVVDVLAIGQSNKTGISNINGLVRELLECSTNLWDVARSKRQDFKNTIVTSFEKLHDKV